MTFSPQKKSQPTIDLTRMYALFDDRRLEEICRASPETLTVGFERRVGGDNRPHWFKDNGSNILAVAHLDTVNEFAHHGVLELTSKTLVYDAALDDRQGVYTILDLLPKLGINVDILFTTDEEVGQSTAADFKPGKQYNWIVEFDRAGDDLVMYEYGNLAPELEDALDDTGFNIGRGSFTDISSLTHLGVGAFNVGIGYEDNHNEEAYFDLGTYLYQMELFVDFWRRNRDVQYHFDPTKRAKSYRQSYVWPEDNFVQRRELAAMNVRSSANFEAVCPHCYEELDYSRSTHVECPGCWTWVSLGDAYNWADVHGQG